MKTHIILLLLVISNLIHAQGKRTDKEYYPNGNLKSEAVYDHVYLGSESTRDGVMRTYKPVADGKFTAYYNNGNVFVKGEFAKNKRSHPEDPNFWTGRRVGTWKIYSEDGELATIKKYNYRTSREERTEYVKLFDLEYIYRAPFGKRQKIGVYTGKQVLEIEKENIYFNSVNHLFDDGRPVFTGFIYGEWNYHDKNGVLQSIRKYEKPEPFVIESFIQFSGPVTYYYESGSLQSKARFFNGKKIGIWNYYDEDGNVTVKGEWDDKDRIGEWIFYFDNGEISKISNYSEGKLTGKNTNYWENGTVKLVRLFENGNHKGYWEQNLEDGTQILKNGNGAFSTFHENGEVEMKAAHKNGSRDGITTWYYDNGQTTQSAYYKYDESSKPFGLRWEIISSFHKDGREREKGTLKDGNGTWLSYDENGDVLETSEYKNGVKIE